MKRTGNAFSPLNERSCLALAGAKSALESFYPPRTSLGDSLMLRPPVNRPSSQKVALTLNGIRQKEDRRVAGCSMRVVLKQRGDGNQGSSAC
jgi:hypothetical protein